MEGGNSLNIINICSDNISNKIIRNNDLNGCILPYDRNVWNYYDGWDLCQDNIQTTALLYCNYDTRRSYYPDKFYIDTRFSHAPFFQINYR